MSVNERSLRRSANPEVTAKFATEVSLRGSVRLLRSLIRRTSNPIIVARYEADLERLRIVYSEVHYSPPFLNRSGEIRVPRGMEGFQSVSEQSSSQYKYSSNP